MRTDVKIALVASIVLIILIVVYIALIHHPRKTVMQNTEASSVPPLVQSNNPATSTAGTTSGASLASTSSIGGSASVPATNPVQIPAGTTSTAPSVTTAPSTSTMPSTAPTMPSTAVADNGGLNNGTDAAATMPGAENSNSLTDAQATGVAGLNTGTGMAGGMGTGTANGGNSGSAASGGNISPTTISPTTSAGGRYYRIRQGDTLAGISRAVYGTTAMVTAIEAANPGVSARDLRIGQRIRLPRKSRHASTSYHSTSYHPAQRHAPHGGRVYIVRRGDTLYSIARRVYHNGGDWKLIYRANRHKIGSNPSAIYGGERLIIPAR